MNRATFLALVAAALASTGCEYAFSDVATRIRYRLADAMGELNASKNDTLVVTLRPDHWPDACPKEGGYKLQVLPDKGGKQVATGDIRVTCNGGHPYYTGLGSEKLFVAKELSVQKKRDEDLRITLRKATAGIEITALE